MLILVKMTNESSIEAPVRGDRIRNGMIVVLLSILRLKLFLFNHSQEGREALRHQYERQWDEL